MRSLRVVTLNLWNDRPDVAKRMKSAIDGLRALQPDVVALQEVVDSPATGNQAEQIARDLDCHWVYDPVEETRAAGPIGNAIVSRFPIRRKESHLLPSVPEDPRRAVLALIDTPMGALPMVSVHLSWEMWVTPRREAQAVALDEFVRAHPADLPPIVCGDFNSPPDSLMIWFMTGKASLHGRGTYYRDAFARRRPHSDGHTWSDRNPYAVRWVERNRRLDYIFVGPIRPDGWGAVLDARVVLDMPGPDGVYASDHFAVYAEIGMAALEEAV